MTKADWPIVQEIPEGWAIDKTCGSPIAHHVFITNKKSVLNGQKRALLYVKPEKIQQEQNTINFQFCSTEKRDSKKQIK
jgi:hypothetical protein